MNISVVETARLHRIPGPLKSGLFGNLKEFATDQLGMMTR